MLDLFTRGGPVMWPLLILSIVCLTVIFERLWFIFRTERGRDRAAVVQIFAAVEKGRLTEAASIFPTTSDYVARVLSYGIGQRGESLTNALLVQANLELRRFSKGIFVLDTAITVAPLLGLLGTVTGMIHSFGLLGNQELSTPTVITGGIAEALIATACGLGVAIASVFPFNFLSSKLEDARHEIEDACTRLEVLYDRRKGNLEHEQ